MAFEITSDTVVKILVRRGLETERLQTLLSEGELGLSVDSHRLFVGDGYTLGGTPVGNLNFGTVDSLVNIQPYAQPGDMAFCKNLNYVYGGGNQWITVSPLNYRETYAPVDLCYTLEYSPVSNALRISDNGLGDGLVIDYSEGGNGNIDNTIQKAYGQLNFDARFLSLCAFKAPDDSTRIGSLYLGNIFTSTTKNNLSNTVNIENNLSINDHSLSAFQLKMVARGTDYNSSLIEATSGSLYIRSSNQIYLGTKTNGCTGLSVASNDITVAGSTSFKLSGGSNIVLDTATGSKIGTATVQKLGFYNATPIVQPTSPGLTSIDTAGAGTTVNSQSKFTGGLGTTQYSISDIVRVLKNLGLIAQ